MRRRWLGYWDSCRRNLKSYAAGQKLNAQWEVLRFSVDGGTWVFRDKPMFRWHPSWLEWPKIEALKDKALKTVTGFIDKGSVTFPAGKGDMRIITGYPSPLFEGHDLQASFFYVMGHLMARFGPRIRKCKGCEVFMLIGRKDKSFHSASCQVTTYIREKRNKAKQTKGGRHGTH